MPNDQLYTYRNGEKLPLNKHPHQFVARALPDELRGRGFPAQQQLSSASSLLVCTQEELEPMMRALRLSVVCHHLYTQEGQDMQFLITDRIFLHFKEGSAAFDMANLIENKHLDILREYNEYEYLVQITAKTGVNPVKLVVDLVENHGDLLENVDHDLNYIAYKSALQLPNDSSYRAQWHLSKQFNLPDVDPRACSNCEDAWKELNNFGSKEVVIGITDDGCDMNHGDFNTSGKFKSWAYLEGINLRKKGDRGADVRKMYQSGINHGTACAGVAAASVNNTMTVGAAPNCKLLPIKWETGADGRMFVSDAKLVEILNFCSDKVDVLSSSWSDTPINSRSVQVTTLINNLGKRGGRRDKGIVFLWSAGNNNAPIHHTSSFEIPYDAGLYWVDGAAYWIVTRAKTFYNSFNYLPGVLVVGAIASTAQRAHYSNYGQGLSLTASSSNQHAYNRIQLKGRPITTTLGGNTTRSDFGGTSSATPLAAGIAALVVSANPELTALEVIEVMKRTASKNLNMEGYPKTPFDPNWDTNERDWDISPVSPFQSGAFQNLGLPDGSWSPWFGHGKVDALAAVKEAIRRRPAPGTTPPRDRPGIFIFRPYHISGTAHFAIGGERRVRGGLAFGGTAPGQQLTGFSLNFVERTTMQVWYEAVMEDGSRSGWVQEGGFAGNRNGNLGVRSIGMRLQSGQSGNFSISYRIMSRGSGISKACMDGAFCSVPVGSDILAFTVSIKRKRV